MRFILKILLVAICANIGKAQPLLERKIDWNAQSQTKGFYDKKFLWFENAIYLNPKTMLPSYFELIEIDEGIINIDNLEVYLENEIWELLTDSEKGIVHDQESIDNRNLLYKTSTAAGKNYVELTIPTIKVSTNNELVKLVSFNIRINSVSKKGADRIILSKKTVKSNSVLSSGNWIKISVKNSGIYKITYSELQSNGLNNLSNISVWGNGGKSLPYLNNQTSPDDLNPIPIYLEKGSDGIFNQGDYILFYAEGPKNYKYNSSVDMWTEEQHPYSTKAHYFLTTDQVQNIITNVSEPAVPANYSTNVYDAIVTFEKNDTNLVKSGREWFGDIFDLTTTRNYNTNLSNPEIGSTLKVWLRAASRSSASTSYEVKLNSSSLGLLPLNAVSIGDDLADVVSVNSQVFNSTTPLSNISIDLIYSKSNSTSVGWLDFLTVNARQQLVYNNSQLQFRDTKSVGSGNVTEFTLHNANQNIQIWDITDINQAKIVLTQLSGSSLKFKDSTAILKQYIAFETVNTLSVSFEGSVSNQNLHGLNQPDMVIVTHKNFISQAQELASIHETNDGLSVAVVTNEQVYNEFSSGNPDVSAIRNLMRMFYQRANNEEELPRYLLLFGDGSYNNISTKSNNTNYVLTYQSERSISSIQSFVTDDYFGLLDTNEGEADGLLDIGVGRFPVRTTDEANLVIEKIKQYISCDNIGLWQNQLCFIGDDEDGNIHMQDANTLSDYIRTNHPEYNVQKIFFDAYNQVTSSAGSTYPDANKAINTTINNGALLVNYTGHGNERWLSHEKVIMLNDVLSWKNFQSLSLFVTATCEFSRFDDYNQTSTGEWVLLSPNGAGIALLTTTRVVYSNPNFVLNYNFIKNIFAKKGTENTYNTLGDLVKITKNLSGSGYNKRNFTLLGDPALKLRYPKYNMELLEINGIPINEEADTLKALSKINLTGQVVDLNGKIAPNFTGTATITVFDKVKNITTLANDGGNPMTFETRDNIIYRGNATVYDGKFSLDFVVPKDISYQFGTGKISLFATNTTETAIGSNEALIVGGISSNPTIDNAGPKIELYLNDENFKNGGICDPNPKLYIKLYDESGINTTGIGIGHDLMATLSSSTDNIQKFNLNSYYQSELDDFKKGRIEYQLSNLSSGVKKVKVKAWDIYNNSSEAEISFNVTSGNTLLVKNFISYPNPFSDNTNMYFEHNQPDASFNVEVQVYNFSGMLVKKILFNEQNSGNYRIGPIIWNGLNNNGGRLGRGVYICRLIVKSSTGETAQLQQKLVIMR